MGRAMTAATPAMILLIELFRQGIDMRAVGDRLRYRPRSAMTPDLARRVVAHRSDLLAILEEADGTVTYTDAERQLLGDRSASVIVAVDEAKRAFRVIGGVTVTSVVPFKSRARDTAARLIRDARGADDGRAVALRDAWRERLAVCTMDGELSERDAETVAAKELKSMIAQRASAD